MDSSKLASLQKAASSSEGLIQQFVEGDQTLRLHLLTKLNSDYSIDFSELEIQELSVEPEPLMNGLELSDEHLAAVAGGGKTAAGGITPQRIGPGGLPPQFPVSGNPVIGIPTSPFKGVTDPAN